MNNPYIVTLSARRISLEEGVPLIHDIAISHCRTPMFAGHTDHFYSVAHHCLSAAKLASYDDDKRLAILVLMHEAETAVFGDVPGPVKCKEHRHVERAVRARIFKSFGMTLPEGLWEMVEFYDKIEQAASTTFLGLTEPVHQQAWMSASEGLRHLARQVTEGNYRLFPAKEQLERDSPLSIEFVSKFNRYAADCEGES